MFAWNRRCPSTRRKLLIQLLLVSCLALSAILDSRAQTTTSGGLTGVVTDPSNAVVPDAVVEIRDLAKGTEQSTKTDREGVYRFFFLTPSTYTLTVTHDGFHKLSRTVSVLLGPPGTVNATLKLESGSTAITVTGEAPLLQADNGDVSTTMNEKQINEIPNPGNDLTYIAQTAPGTIMNTDASPYGNSIGNFSILGMPGNSYHYTLDGMTNNENSNNTALSGAVGLVLGLNQIQEATVISTGYSGQFGGAAGGNINYITKSGSNEYHGNAQYYWNGRVLNANDWFNNANGLARPFDIVNQWAGSFGGPIRKGTLFFFLDGEGLRLVLPQTYQVVIPSPQFEAATIANVDSKFGIVSASDEFYRRIFALYNAAPGASSAQPGGLSASTDPSGCTGFTGVGLDPNTNTPIPCARNFVTSVGRPSSDWLGSGRVDWNIGSSDRLFIRMQSSQGAGSFYSDPINASFDAVYNVSLWQGQILATHTFGTSGASQFLVAAYSYSYEWKTRNLSQALSLFPTALNFYATGGGFSPLGGEDWIGAYGGTFTHYQMSEDVVKSRGSQKFGFGAIIEPIRWSILPNTVNAIGQLSPQTLNAFYQGGVDLKSPTADFTSLTQSFTSQSTVPVSFFRFGVYGQDEWHARPNLTLTLAVRAEHYANPTCENNCFSRLIGPFESVSHDPAQPYNQAILTGQKRALQGTDSILWSPRFSFAWQPLGVSGNGVLRGGVGLFYDPLPDGNMESFYINSPNYNVFTPFSDNLTPNEKTSLFKDAAASNAAFLNGFAAGQNLGQIQALAPNFSPPAINAAQKTFHNPQYQKWSLQWEQAIRADATLSVGYFGNHGIHELVANPDANAYGFGSLPSGLCSSPPVLPCADPRFSQVTEKSTQAISNYNGMVISYQQHFSRWGGGIFQANYTYGHTFDEVSNGGQFSFTSGSSSTPQDPNNLRGSYGPAEYDVRHSLNASYVWDLPLKSVLRGRGLDYLLEGWQVSGTVFARTGFPYTVFDFTESGSLVANNYYGKLYSVPTGPIRSTPSCGAGAAAPAATNPCLQPQVLADGLTPNPNALFLQTGCETAFNNGHLPGPSGPCSGPIVSFAQGRNRFRGPRYFNTDFAITKTTKIPHWENGVLRIGFQFFNVFNHPNFGLPDNYSSDSTFGQIFYLEQPPTSIVGAGLGGDAAPRMVQLKAELRF